MDLLTNEQSTRIIFNSLEGNYALCLLGKCNYALCLLGKCNYALCLLCNYVLCLSVTMPCV